MTVTKELDTRGDDYNTVDFYDNWGDIRSGSFGKHWDKVHPDKSNAYIGRQISETKTLLKAELRVLVDYAR